MGARRTRPRAGTTYRMCRSAKVWERSASLEHRKRSVPLAQVACNTFWLARGDKNRRPCATTKERLTLASSTTSMGPGRRRTSREGSQRPNPVADKQL
eukprot:2960965-Amphidinium_carterae.1